MKPICIIPARNGSKGIPNKNITKILGTPLIGHVIRNVRNSKIFSHVIVSTEDRTIAKIAKNMVRKFPLSAQNIWLQVMLQWMMYCYMQLKNCLN